MGMSEMQKRFYNRVNLYVFGRYWNEISNELDIEGLSNALGAMSSGERHLAQFYASIWLKHDVPEVLRFDIVRAVQVLDTTAMNEVADWVRAPWWP